MRIKSLIGSNEKNSELGHAVCAYSYLNSAPRLPLTSGGIGTLELVGSQMTFGPNEEIFGENEPGERVYKVMKGAVRTYKILSDGRRQVGAFYFPGDIFGSKSGMSINFPQRPLIRQSCW